MLCFKIGEKVIIVKAVGKNFLFVEIHVAIARLLFGRVLHAFADKKGNSKMRLLPITLLTALLFVLASCHLSLGAKHDAVTGATPKYQHGKTALPPEVGAYKVIGVLNGLKKYVIRYDNKLYRGGEPFADSAVQSLKKYGIRTVISITPTDQERKLCKDNGLTLVEIPFEKTKGLSPDDLKRYLKTLKTGASPFYVHCHGGTHRGGVLGVAYRVHIQGWPYEKALVEHGRLGGDLMADHIMLESVRKIPK